MKRSACAARVLGLLSGLLVIVASFGETSEAPDRDNLAKLTKQGNWKEAYDGYYRLATDPADDPAKVSADLRLGLRCLQQLGRIDEVDGFLEKTIAAHAKNWRLLQTAAEFYTHLDDYSGTIIAGEYHRGPQRGGDGKWVNSYERNRVRALQLMQQAIGLLPAKVDVVDKHSGDEGDFYRKLAEMFMGQRGYNGAWRLQYLTDLATLPDYDEMGNSWGGYYGRGATQGAPVNEDGTPVYYSLPKSWKEAANDGQRWRWCLMQAVEYAPGLKGQMARQLGEFLQNQFGVQTMASYSWFFSRVGNEEDSKKDESGTWALHTLGEDETIARLATGIKRFKLPDEFNYIKIFEQLADEKSAGDQPVTALCNEFQNRRQYDKAADWWRRNIKDYGDYSDKSKEAALNQIIQNWGVFEPIMTQPSGKGATVEYRFRNGHRVSFEAWEINVPKLLGDVKDYLKSDPRQIDGQKIDIGNLGYRLVEKDEKQYLGNRVAAWDLDLKPRANHWDKRVTVATPLQKAGAYLLEGRMADGNVSRIIVWVADTAIVRKPLADKAWYYVADATTGQPVAKANLEFFGYWQERVEDNKEKPRAVHYVVHTRDFAEMTDADGQLIIGPDRMENPYSLMVIATTPEGRLAYDGFSGIWYGRPYDPEYNQAKYYTITDRPVYRPEQKVKFKVWAGQAQYDREGDSPYANQPFTVRVENPKGEKVFEQQYTSDRYGGFDGELTLPKGATLGVYNVQLVNLRHIGSFRVEEYKKPEFEVKVEAPTEPIMLGEKIEAKIIAKYYFGAPVTEGKVKYKVLRTTHEARWYPVAWWDWFYEPGYWWFAYDYAWYPGWRDWGCKRPLPVWWWQWNPQQPPEVVAEAEVPVGKDGTVKVAIDTAVAKAIYGDTDQRYEITAEVTDLSRRTIVGQGQVLVAHKPFKVYAWVDRGYFRAGDVVQAHFSAQTLDQKPVVGKGDLRLLKITYDKAGKPVEKTVESWKLDTTVEGKAHQQIKAAEAGQYRLSYKLTDSKGHEVEGGYVFVVRGQGFDNGGNFRFDDLELVTDKKEYAPGDKVNLMVNTERKDGAVLLFVRPTNGVYLPPKMLRLTGKSVLEEIAVVKKDMPNFFVEGLTVSGGKVYTDVREIVVPPENRVLDVKVQPSAEKYKPGEQATVKLKITDPTGEPVTGSVVVAIYDKAVEYISGGSNVPEIKEFFWKWRRHHHPVWNTSLNKGGYNILRSKEIPMGFLGVYGYATADEGALMDSDKFNLDGGGGGGVAGFGNGRRSGGPGDAIDHLRMQKTAEAAMAMPAAAPSATGAEETYRFAAKEKGEGKFDLKPGSGPEGNGQAPLVQPTVRTEFADTALWVGALEAGKDGLAEVSLKMPENLTTWKTRVWAMGGGTRVGEGAAEVVTTKNLIIRLQAPRFFVQKDEVVLSANVHNYLKTKKKVNVVLEIDEFDGAFITSLDAKIERVDAKLRTSKLPGWEMTKTAEIDAGGEKRVDWRIRVDQPGQIAIRMKALTDEESDATEMKFPVFIHGMLKTDSFSGVMRPEKDSASVTVKVPKDRLPEQSRLEVRWSPTLAGVMVDALPYMVDYPYGCTEQTLNRFLPTVITQKVLIRMGLDLKDIQKKQTNLNAQEIGDDAERAKDWAYRGGYMSRATAKVKNPVFDEAEVRDMVKAGIERLTSMQCSDGGWGWFSGWGEQSWPHTTAVVVHGLQLAQANDVALVPGVLERGVEWLKRHQAAEVEKLKNFPGKKDPWKEHADELDALVYMVLVDAKIDNQEMREFLYRDRNSLAVYAKAMVGIACQKLGDVEKRDMLVRNIEQFLVQDDENQTAYLKLPENNWWWCWYGSEYEAQAYYLKLLCVVEPKGEKASRLVKYLANNRRNASYWNSTRDTAVVIEAFADYMKASGETTPDMTLTVLVDGKAAKEVKINKDNLFSFDNKLVLAGDRLTSGEHKIELRRQGTGPVYFNAYLTNFSLEDPITKAGLEIKVSRKFYKLIPGDKKIHAAGSRGQAVDQKVEKYERKELANLDTLKSGDLVEVELEIDSKNDYEYIMFEDMKAAGFEPVEVRSGYNGNDLRAYMELRDERVTFFVRALARGKHSVSYRLRAEIPGKFSALPAKAGAMYAPELKANSDEWKLKIAD